MQKEVETRMRFPIIKHKVIANLVKETNKNKPKKQLLKFDFNKFILEKNKENEKSIVNQIGFSIFFSTLKKSPFDDYPGLDARIYSPNILNVKATDSYVPSQSKRLTLNYKFKYEEFLKKIEDEKFFSENWASRGWLVDFFEFVPQDEESKKMFEEWCNYSIMFSSGIIKKLPYYVFGVKEGNSWKAYGDQFVNLCVRQYMDEKVLKKIEDICISEIKKDTRDEPITKESLKDQEKFHQILTDFFIVNSDENNKRFQKIIYATEIFNQIKPFFEDGRGGSWVNFIRETLFYGKEGAIVINFQKEYVLEYTEEGTKYLSKATNPFKLKKSITLGTIFAGIAAFSPLLIEIIKKFL